ncbi:MAG: hypoxanthine phosphoribosyltransferase [Synergistes sp.]|nr:hypoxanthine phosphoribosyltransferase [Synergistes sp.]
MDYKIGRVLISKKEIHNKVKELGEAIRRDHEGETVICVCILKGAFIFCSDLVREIGADVDVRVDFMRISSYGMSDKSSGEVNIVNDVSSDVKGKHVIIVEDIYETGLSLEFAKKHLEDLGAKSVDICVIFDKPNRHEHEVYVKYKGLDIPDDFVIGYGLDYASKFRDLKELHIAEPVTK